jgi:hypothetical protein
MMRLLVKIHTVVLQPCEESPIFLFKKTLKNEILHYVQDDKKVNLQKFWKTLLEGIDEYEV